MITITLSSSSCGCPAPPSLFVLLSHIFSSPCLSAWRAFNIPICGPTDEGVSPFLSRKSHCFASCFSVIFTGRRSLNRQGFLLLRLCVFTGLLLAWFDRHPPSLSLLLTVAWLLSLTTFKVFLVTGFEQVDCGWSCVIFFIFLTWLCNSLNLKDYNLQYYTLIKCDPRIERHGQDQSLVEALLASVSPSLR